MGCEATISLESVLNVMFYLGLFTLGALDALQPGHAKSIVSSYVVGANARLQQLAVLGLVVTLTHIVVNGALAYGIVSFASAVFDHSYVRYVNLIAGAMIMLLALYLVWQRFIKKESSCCGHHSHCHSNEVSDSSDPMTLWQIIVLGITSGLTPCPVVLTALISAISLGQGFEALLGVALFSLGMGLVIFMVGLVTLLGMKKVQWFNQPANSIRLSKISAVAILFLGSFLVTKSLFFYEAEEEPPVNLIMISEQSKL